MTKQQTHLDKPTLAKSFGNKFLVALLCAMSFYAGFYAHQARQINHCHAQGQEIITQGSVVICQDK